MNDRQADTFVLVAMAIAAVIAVALFLSGCSSSEPYPVKMKTMRLVSPNMTTAQASNAPVLTIFSQQQGILAMVCGAVVQYQNGQPAQMISGNCNTPLALIAGLVGPMGIGLGAALWSAP